ncbi:hypothetical protein HAX54_026374 [Datura stramonium]|uniref:Uncharacterized protein n=1 Tax=Datura stramonium TaxID=4076 RepID=A0ABS8RKW0_DATST|nr:hypothetical protein [Datura stramonium]
MCFVFQRKLWWLVKDKDIVGAETLYLLDLLWYLESGYRCTRAVALGQVLVQVWIFLVYFQVLSDANTFSISSIRGGSKRDPYPPSLCRGTWITELQLDKVLQFSSTVLSFSIPPPSTYNPNKQLQRSNSISIITESLALPLNSR